MVKAITSEEILRNKIIELALNQNKKIYEHGKHGPDSFDCAGFVWYIYHEILDIDIYKDGIGKSTTTKIMTSTYGKLTLYAENILDKDFSLIKGGDILLFHRQSKESTEPKENNKYPGHCGIYLGNKTFIHAPRKKGYINIQNFDNSQYWTKKLVASKDIFKTIK